MYRKDKKMCKYCKNLKRIKDLDKEEYLRIIKRWRNRDLKARKLLCDALDLLGYRSCDKGLRVDLSDTLKKSNNGGFRHNEIRFVMNVLEFLNSNWIGK